MFDSQLKSYEYVITVAKHGSVSQAAESLNIAQSALSRYIKKLEAELKIDLFDRSVIPIRLTEAGKCYVDIGYQLLRTEQELNKKLQEIKTNKNSLIRIGISPTRSSYIMPMIFEEYMKISPQCKFTVEEYTSAELSRKLERGELDVMISWLDQDTEAFERIELFDEKILLAVPRQWECDNKDVLDVLNNKQLISTGNGQALWHVMQNLLKNIGVSPPNIECKSIETSLAFVKSGFGAALVPSYIANYGTKELKDKVDFFQLPDNISSNDTVKYQRKICLFYRKNQYLSFSERCFINCVKEVFL